MIERLFDKLDRIPDVAVLLINGALGAFVLLAHGGALLLVLSGKVSTPPGYEAMVRGMTPITLPIAGLVVISSLAGLVGRGMRRSVIMLQGTILFVAGIGMAVWSGRILTQGIPPGNFAWTPGLLTGWVFYSGLLCSRLAVDNAWTQRLRWMVAAVAVATLGVDVGVFVRFLAKMSRL